MNDKLKILVLVEEFEPGYFEYRISIKGGPRSAFYKAIETLKRIRAEFSNNIEWQPTLRYWRCIAGDSPELIPRTEVEAWLNNLPAIVSTPVDTDKKIVCFAEKDRIERPHQYEEAMDIMLALGEVWTQNKNKLTEHEYTEMMRLIKQTEEYEQKHKSTP